MCIYPNLTNHQQGFPKRSHWVSHVSLRNSGSGEFHQLGEDHVPDHVPAGEEISSLIYLFLLIENGNL
jgi:hypothetical protein